MMFLLRAAFWIGVLLVLLPSGAKQKPADTPAIGASQAASAAGAAVADLSQFCTREPDSCAVGTKVAVVLAHRAQAGAAMIYDFLAAKRNASSPAENASPASEAAAHPEATGSIAPPAAQVTSVVMLPRPRPQASQDTLTASDRRPAWRGPVTEQSAPHTAI
jgi:hypothetical protein